eukprot:4510613-Pyramimonas_sp.AAC.1
MCLDIITHPPAAQQQDILSSISGKAALHPRHGSHQELLPEAAVRAQTVPPSFKYRFQRLLRARAVQGDD